MARPALVTVPTPATDAMDIAVREQLDEQLAATEALAADPSTPDAELADAFGLYGQLAFTYQLAETARAAFANAALLAPDDHRWPHYGGLVDFEAGRFDDAHEAFARALELSPIGHGAIATRLRLGEALLQLGRPDNAREAFIAALQALQPSQLGRAAALFGLGRAEAATRGFADAARHFRDALELEPTASVVHYHLGLAYRELGELDAARAELRQRGTTTPALPDPLFAEARRLASGAAADQLRATRALRRGDLDTAIALFEKAIATAPDDIQAWRGLLTALNRAGRPDAAVARYRTALAAETSSPLASDAELQLQVGLLLEGLGQGEEALAAFRAALAVAPDLRDARFNLGLALKRRGDLAEAAQHLERAVELDPLDTGARLELASVLGLTGQATQALAAVEAVLAIAPENPRAHLEHALALGRGGRFADSAAAYDRFLALEPGFAEAHVGRAMALLFAERCADAAARLAESHAALPAELRLEHLLARVLATCPDPAGRDGARALALAQSVMSKQQTLDHAETLAMALAEAGRFPEAAEWQRRIVGEAERQGWTRRLPELRSRLDLYTRGEAARAPWK